MFVTKVFKQYQGTIARNFATLDAVPTIDITNFLKQSGDYKEDCKLVAKSFEDTGCLSIKDPRVLAQHNDDFLTMMEKYFEDRGKKYYAGQKNLDDFYPDLGYQTGATPEGIEIAREHSE